MPRIENSSGESIPDILIIAWGPFSLFLFSNFTDFFLGAVLNPVLSYPPFPKECLSSAEMLIPALGRLATGKTSYRTFGSMVLECVETFSVEK